MSDAIEGHVEESPLNLNTETEVAPVEVAATESAAVTPPVETKAETKPEVTPDDERLRRGYAALARKEKAIRAQEQESKRLAGIEKLAKESPLEALKALGLSYDQLTDLILGNEEKGEPTADDRVAALEARLENERKERETAAKAQADADTERKINTFKTGVLAHGIKSNPDKYECINARGGDGVELVWEVIESYHEANGEVLNWEVAAEQVEKHLEDEARAMLGLKKFKQATAPQSQAQRSEGTNTLSRSNAGELPVVTDEELSLDPDERTRALTRSHRLWT